MNITAERVGKTMVKRYELTKKEVELLAFIKKHGRIHFRNLKFRQANPMDESNTYSFKEYEDLVKQEFVIEDPHQWHTYILTPFAEQFMKEE